MVQLGQSIQCIVALLVDHHNLHHPSKFAKLDAKDGFWRLIVNEEEAWNFCYVLPPKDGHNITNLDKVELVVPLSIQIGANHHAPPPDRKAADLLEVFVDDFIGCTNDITTKHLTAISRAIFHGLHSVYPPPEVTGHPGRDSCGKKKLQKEEGRWEYAKEILGWTFNGKTSPYSSQKKNAIAF
eukprot:994036-Ditylum_brightwellii.AAC.1